MRASCSKRAKAIKGKEQAQTNGELTDNALGEIRRGEAKFPDAFSSEVLKAMAAHLCPDLKLGQTREVVLPPRSPRWSSRCVWWTSTWPGGGLARRKAHPPGEDEK